MCKSRVPLEIYHVPHVYFRLGTAELKDVCKNSRKKIISIWKESIKTQIVILKNNIEKRWLLFIKKGNIISVPSRVFKIDLLLRMVTMRKRKKNEVKEKERKKEKESKGRKKSVSICIILFSNDFFAWSSSSPCFFLFFLPSDVIRDLFRFSVDKWQKSSRQTNPQPLLLFRLLPPFREKSK